MKNPNLIISPCPFCGGTNAQLSNPCQGTPVKWTVICTPEVGLNGCGASSTWCNGEDEAVEAWNRRDLNENYIRKQVTDPDFIMAHVAMLKIGHERGESIEDIVRTMLASAFLMSFDIDITSR